MLLEVHDMSLKSLLRSTFSSTMNHCTCCRLGIRQGTPESEPLPPPLSNNLVAKRMRFK